MFIKYKIWRTIIMADEKVLKGKDLEAYNKYVAFKEKEKRYWAKQAIILQKAKEKGITATDAEVDAYIKTMKKKS